MATTQSTSDATWGKIRRALENENYDFRTVHGISRETGLSEEEIQDFLDKFKADVRISYSTDKKGNLLYTLRGKPKSIQERISDIKSIVSSSSRSD